MAYRRMRSQLDTYNKGPVLSTSRRASVVIVGAGFAGLAIAQRLANTGFDVVLLDRNNYHTFQPLIHQVATAELTPNQIACPVRRLLRKAQNVRFQMAEVVGIDPIGQVVITQQVQYRYDFLVIATGSRVPLERFSGAKEFGWPLKTIPHAVALRNQVIRSFEQAAALPEVPSGLLTFIIVGGGATGVELAGALQDWIARSLVKDYSALSCQDIRVVLLQSGDRLLPGFSSRLQTYTKRHLQKLGVEVRLSSRVSEVSVNGITLSDGSSIASRTVIWTTGVKSDRPKIKTSLPTSELSVLPTLQLANHCNVYIAGDSIGHLQPKQTWPQLAAAAIQQGKAVSLNLLRQSRGQSPLPFRYQHRGNMAILSRYAAVVQIGPLELTGFSAWAIWLVVHIVLLRGHRTSTLLQWWTSHGRGERSAQTVNHGSNELFLAK
ncbi:MAG: NAD(P)/FAD-dependent oxidoreductase [Cyanobacteria bacterium P01_A01_bin.116]